ncbi:NAD-dependent epimerase/dehydratase family protein [Salinarimonas chemoclinalis]|uniref:NAD-dependent epimerase/dehydratase family protein n=1 Tax=Salinarimonas chemoclinalis TaxID=3241599 RepID=UPI00355724B7
MAKTYLITGGMGFIGRALAAELTAHGHAVRLLDSLVEQVHGEIRDDDAPPVPEGCDFVRADVRDADAVHRAIAGVDGVFHLAAEVGVGQSMYEIERYTSANDVGTAVLLQELIEQPVARVVVASSMSVYGEGWYRAPDGSRIGDARRDRRAIEAGRWDPVVGNAALTPIATDETKPVDLASIYALGKYAQERAVMIACPAYGMDCVGLRLFNVFGPGQALSNPYTGVLANFAARYLVGEAPTIFEDGQQKRDFVHVEDVARAFRLAMETPEANGEVINIGSGRAYTVCDVARLLGAAMGVEIEPEILGRARAGDIRHCFADIVKAREILGFQPRHRLETALGPLVAWVASQKTADRGAEMRRHLEARGLVT